jgi:integrase
VTLRCDTRVGHHPVPSMKPSPSYLTLNRHGTFYFRMVIPPPLRALLNGQREVRRTLKTDSERLARKRARQYVAHFEAAFDKVMKVIEVDGIELTDELLAQLDEFEALNRAPADFSDPQDRSKPAELILSDEESAERQRMHCIAALLTGKGDRPIPEDLEHLAEELLAASRAFRPAELPRQLPKIRDGIVQRKIGSAGAPTSTAPAQASTPAFDPAMADWTLYDVWKDQLKRDRADTTAKGGQAKHGGTLEERERRARVMTVLTLHRPVCHLTKQDWQAAFDAARRMKAGAKASISPPTPLSDFLTDHPEQMTGHERVSALITSMKEILNHARFLDLTTVRPDDLIIKPVQRRETPRTRGGKAFTMAEVETIFSGYIYQGALPSNRTKAYPFWFWLPLIGYFTGARTNEIAQLDTADVREIDGHPCFDFCPDDPKTPEAKRVKTEEARQVPIHPRLIELGFLKYVEAQRKAKQKKLFGDGLTYLPPRDGETDHNKEGWAKAASKFFNEAPKGYLVEIGVHKTHDGKSLYSFRHTLETNLRHARRDGKPIDQSIIDAISGHTPETIAGRHYDGGATIAHKLEALKQIPIPNAIKRLTSYQKDFAERFGKRLENSIKKHRMKYPRKT